MMSPNKKNRVTLRHMSPNPLFEEWLTIWKDEAIEKGSKMQYCFGTALQSLKRYPIPLESGKECKILKGFGDKLCMMLDQKLKEHKSTEKVANDGNLHADLPRNNEINITKKTRAPKTKPIEAYIPQHGSGGYAILLSLLVKSQEVNFKGHMGKAEIIEHARTLSNKSFTLPDPGSFYTAWSSMQTLISKGFVIKWSNPAKFKLTDQGLALAMSLQEQADLNRQNIDDCFGSPNGNRCTKQDAKASSESNSYINTNRAKQTSEIVEINDYDPMDFEIPGTSNENRFNFLHCDELIDLSDLETRERSPFKAKAKSQEGFLHGEKNANPLDEDFLKVISKYSSQEEIAAQQTLLSRYSLDAEKLTNGNMTKNITNNNNVEKGVSKTQDQYKLDEEFLKIAAKYSKSVIVSSKSGNSKSGEYATKQCNINYYEPVKTNSEIETYANSDNANPNQNQTKPKDNNISIKRTLSESCTSEESNKKSIKPKLGKFPSESSKESQKSLKSFKSDVSDSSEITEAECFLMGPQGFDIILLVDNQENSDSKNEEIQDVLKSQSIKFEIRDLKVGDYAWICRCRMSEKELILPYIVERKRMDDFGSSIKDGRYYEQKFRLKRSGIENLIYLIESHGKNSSVGLPLSSLHQAATNTALQDNFFIKFTSHIKETTNYLVNFSKSLIKLYKDKTLISSARDDLKPVDLNDDLIYLMEFKQFNKSSTKSQKMKVTDMFVKMLIQIKGMSVEKAIAIAEKYPTLMDLYQAYEDTVESQKEKLLSNIKYGKFGKTVGAVLSRTVYQLFTYDSY